MDLLFGDFCKGKLYQFWVFIACGFSTYLLAVYTITNLQPRPFSFVSRIAAWKRKFNFQRHPVPTAPPIAIQPLKRQILYGSTLVMTLFFGRPPETAETADILFPSRTVDKLWTRIGPKVTFFGPS
jgi:hypothetical protein